MEHVLSSDGTAIAYDRIGQGQPLILVVGAFNTRSTGEPLAAALASRFTVYTYDRRGRGDSADTAPYAIQREVDDLGALIAAAGGSAAVFGYSSGALLALHAAASDLPITRVALYDAPFRPALEALAHTLVYDATLLDDCTLAGRLAAVSAPTLVVAGGDNPFMSGAANALA